MGVAMGLLSPKGAPSFHPAGDELKAAAAEAAKVCEEQKVDIVKLATHFALSQPEPATTLTMCNTLDALRKIIKMIQQNLWPQEKSAMEEVLNIFSALEKRDWVGQDRVKFYEKCKEKKSGTREKEIRKGSGEGRSGLKEDDGEEEKKKEEKERRRRKKKNKKVGRRKRRKNEKKRRKRVEEL